MKFVKLLHWSGLVIDDFSTIFYTESGRAVLLKTILVVVLLRIHSFLLTQPWSTGYRLGDGDHGY